MFKENDVIGARYRLLREIGRGGMGVVYEAEDASLERRVAVKVIIPKLARDKKKLERFEAGAKAVAQLNSPHIVQLLEYGVDTVPFMVMELLAGVVLDKRMASGPRFDRFQAARIVREAALALTVAHEHGVVHRNLKPGNIFLVGPAGDETVKVFDFGTAKWLTGFRNANDITTMGAIMGNPDYLAPEQLSGDARSDHRADIWSLGAIAYHLFTGVTPFEGEQMGAIMRSILFTEPDAPTKVDPALPSELDGIFEKALHKTRDGRFQSAKELADAVTDAVGPAPVAVRVAVRNDISEGPDLGDLDSSEQPETRVEGGKDASCADSRDLSDASASDDTGSSGAPSSGAPSSGAPLVEGASQGLPAAVLVASTLPPGRMDLPAWPWLLAGGTAFLLLGGVAAWVMMAPQPAAPRTPDAEGAPVIAESAPLIPGTAAPTSRPQTPSPSPAGSEDDSASTAVPVATDSPAPIPSERVLPPPRPRPPVGPKDIYEGL